MWYTGCKMCIRDRGMGMDPPQFLQPGDTVRCEIDGIGSLTNTVR